LYECLSQCYTTGMKWPVHLKMTFKILLAGIL
jgi:hypothetical protein